MTTRTNLWLAMDDDVTAQRLVVLTRRHSKLALEHIGKDTHSERRKAIQVEIERLRVERDCLLNGCFQQ